MAHINVIPKIPGDGIDNWRELCDRLRKLPHVTAVSPVLYDQLLISGALRADGALLKGIDIDRELEISDTLRHLKSGSVDALRDPTLDPPAVIIGARMSEETGIPFQSRVQITSPQGELAGPLVRPSTRPFRVVGVFETGFYEIDKAWIFTSINAAQRLLHTGDQINQIELNVDDLSRTNAVAKDVEKAAGSEFTTTTWQERNKQLLGALKMERVVTVITIGLIELVAAFNIFITLVMMVMQKYRDIAVLMSMGATRRQVRWIFMLQGVLIGIVGSAIGLVLGYTLCYYGNRYKLAPLDQTIYALSFVPFEPRWADGIWIAAAAILVSFLATIYPARNATRIAPAEVLRYE
jgi:lipoprotein-releasing system permease protein